MATTKPTKPMSVLDMVDDDYAYEIVDSIARANANTAQETAERKIEVIDTPNNGTVTPVDGHVSFRASGNYTSVAGSGNIVTVSTSVPTASTTTNGLVKLVNSVTSTSTTTAATPNSVKQAYDKASTTATTTRAGIVTLSDSTSSTSSSTAATSKAVKDAYDQASTVLKLKQVTVTNVMIPESRYVKITDMSTLGLTKNVDFIVSIVVQGWTGGNGIPTIGKGSDGVSIYASSSFTGEYSSISLEIWYTSFKPK